MILKFFTHADFSFEVYNYLLMVFYRPVIVPTSSVIGFFPIHIFSILKEFNDDA